MNEPVHEVKVYQWVDITHVKLVHISHGLGVIHLMKYFCAKASRMFFFIRKIQFKILEQEFYIPEQWQDQVWKLGIFLEY